MFLFFLFLFLLFIIIIIITITVAIDYVVVVNRFSFLSVCLLNYLFQFGRLETFFYYYFQPVYNFANYLFPVSLRIFPPVHHFQSFFFFNSLVCYRIFPFVIFLTYFQIFIRFIGLFLFFGPVCIIIFYFVGHLFKNLKDFFSEVSS